MPLLVQIAGLEERHQVTTYKAQAVRSSDY